MTLTKDKIGNLELSDKTMISLEKMKSLFPMYKVSHAIGQGDSPDFHYITVSTTEGEELFATYTYFSDDVNKNTKEYKIDLLVTNKTGIGTQFPLILETTVFRPQLFTSYLHQIRMLK